MRILKKKMYISDLVNNYKYTIIWKRDKKHTKSYWGVDTQRRNIILFNTKKSDTKTTELYLHYADIQYKKLYRE